MPRPQSPYPKILGVAILLGAIGLAVVAMYGSDPEDPAFEPYEDTTDAGTDRIDDFEVAVPTVGSRRAGDDGRPGRRPPNDRRRDGDDRERTNEHGVGNDPGPDPSEVPPPPPRKSEPDDQLPLGELDKDDIREGIEAVRPLVKTCYEESLQEFPDAAGRVTIGFRIIGEDGEGRVEMSELDQEKTDLFDERLHDCMLKSIGEAKFEVPGGGGVVEVTYPFQFSSGSEEADE